MKLHNVNASVLLVLVEESFAAGDRLVDALEACNARYRNVVYNGGWQIEISPATPRVRRALADALDEE